MAKETEIAWTDSTFNPWIGCTKVGPGCDNCYAKADFEDRKHRVVWGAGQARSRTKTWGDPVRWNSQHAKFFAEHGRRQRVFCSSLADVFDNEVDPAWRTDLWEVVRRTPNLDWLILTKRISNTKGMLPYYTASTPWANVWIGSTIVNQAEADRDIPKLLAVPAAKRFLSMEPLLGPVNLSGLLDGIDWVIVGGESGPGARPMHPDWARSLRDQCQAAGVPFLFKQWGEWTGPADPIPGASMGDEMRRGNVQLLHAPGNQEGFFRRGDAFVRRIGKKAAGRVLDEILHDGFPL